MDPTLIVLVRHGHTLANAPDAAAPLCGWHDVPLTNRGRFEAVRVGARLRSEVRRYAVYASSSRRAVETVVLMALTAPAAVTCLDELREINCGSVDGLPVPAVKVRHPDLWAANERQDDPSFRWPGGESYDEFRRRCVRVIDALAARHVGRRVLAVTHAGVIGQLVGLIEGVSPACWGRFRPANASITEILWGPGRREVVRFDSREHLLAPDAVARAAAGASARPCDPPRFRADRSG